MGYLLQSAPPINNDLGNLPGMTNITHAYKSIISKIHAPEIVGLATLFAVIIIIVRMVSVIKDAYSDGQPMNIRKMFSLCEEYLKIVVILMFAPIIFYYIELGFSYIQDAYLDRFRYNNNILERYIALKKSQQGQQADWSIGGIFKSTVKFITSPVTKVLDAVFMGIEALVAFIVKYALFLVIGGRFLYLILLQIIQPFAIVASLSDKTRHFTLKYIGHLGYVYILIPFVLIADVFAIELVGAFETSLNDLPFFMLLLACILKLAFYKVANGICKNVMNI